MLDSRPARYPLHRREIKRHDVEPGQKYPIKRPRGGDKIGAASCAKHRGNHGIDSLRLDAHVVTAALLVGGGRAPVEQLLVTRRERLFPAVFHHVKVEADTPALELRGVHRAHARLDSRALEVASE